MSWIFFFSFLLSSAANFACLELINLQLIQSSPNFFDEHFKTFSKSSSSEKLFGFNKKMVCQMEQANKGWTFTFQNVNSLAKTANVLIYLDGEFPSFPLACFEYNQFSYLFFANNIRKEISIYRGSSQKIFKNFITDHIAYDYIASRLYMINNKIIREISLNSLEELWTTQNNTLQLTIKDQFVGNLPKDLSDFLIVDNCVYFIQNGCIYRYPINVKKWQNVQLSYVNNISADFFNFLIYREVHDDGIFLTAKPSSLQEKTTKLWLYLLYFINIFLLFVCAWVVKKLRTNGSLGSGKSTKNSRESYFWDNIPLPNPPTTSFIMEAYPKSKNMINK